MLVSSFKINNYVYQQIKQILKNIIEVTKIQKLKAFYQAAQNNTVIDSFNLQKNIQMSDQEPQVVEQQQVPEKSPQQLQEERKQRQQQEKAKQEQRKRLQEQARVKMQEDMKKLQQAMKGSLSGLGKTHDNRTMAYLKLNLAQKELQRVFPSILNYSQIQHLDISTNAISDPQILLQFPHLITLNLSKNQISSLLPFESQTVLPLLQVLNLSTNKITQLTNIGLKSLRRLNLTENQIAQITWKGHNTIEIVQLRKNKLKKLKGLKDLKSLKQLYACENEITDMRGLENLPSLKRLSLRNNKIKNFMNPFPHLPALQYLNLRENQISSIKQLSKISSHIRQINLLANPVTDQLGQNTKKQIIWVLPHFIKINKSQVTIQERIEFQKEWQEKQAQRERLQKQRQDEQAKRLAEQTGEANKDQ